MTEQNLRRVALGVLIVTSAIFGTALIPAGLVSPMSLLAFDQGVSGAGVLFVLCVMSFPLAVLVSVPGSWVCYRKRVYRAAIAFSLLPVCNILVVALMFAVLG